MLEALGAVSAVLGIIASIMTIRAAAHRRDAGTGAAARHAAPESRVAIQWWEHPVPLLLFVPVLSAGLLLLAMVVNKALPDSGAASFLVGLVGWLAISIPFALPAALFCQSASHRSGKLAVLIIVCYGFSLLLYVCLAIVLQEMFSFTL